MAKAHIHAESSAKRWGGLPENYFPIHEFLDSSKAAIADNRHRALTHNSWFISQVIPRVFGHTFVNSAGKTVSTVDVAERHVLEDFGMMYIPTVADYLNGMEFKSWFNNGKGADAPESVRRLREKPVNQTLMVVD